MKTTIVNIKAALFVSILVLTSLLNSTPAAAQENIYLFYKNNNVKLFPVKEDTKIEFVKKAFINEHNYTYDNPDTIFISSAGGRTWNFGYAESNYDLKLTVDCDWLYTYKIDEKHNEYSGYNECAFLVYAKFNAADEPRYGNLTLQAGDASKKFVVCQLPYTLCFYETPNYETGRLNSVTTGEEVIEWNDTIWGISAQPGVDVELVTYPKWMKPKETYYKQFSFDQINEQNCQSIGGDFFGAVFTFEENTTLEQRTGEFVFRARGKEITYKVTQGIFNDKYAELIESIPSKMSQSGFVFGYNAHATDMGYPAYMIALTNMLGDIYPDANGVGYDWYGAYNVNANKLSDNSYPSYLAWNTFYKYIDTANEIIKLHKDNNSSIKEELRNAVGVAYAFRAFNYYMLTTLYEPKANEYTDCSSVVGLTVPIVTEVTDEERAKNNPRASHDEMVEFILGDLDMAEKHLAEYTPESKLLPGMATVYGIKAKVYMWDEDYANAAIYARKAIDASGASPVTAAQWNDPLTGFNTANQAWLWHTHYYKESMTNLGNLTGWMSGEANWGYSSLTKPGIDASLYNSIADNDFRKYSFLDPAKRDFHDYQTVRDDGWIAEAPAYLALKFRCGEGNCDDYTIGATVDVPIMRVEEMYLIEAEAVAASKSVAEGTALLNSFMQTHRQPNYNFTATDLRTLQLEVLKQMRIEFWGEGIAFASAKRLEAGVMQNYEGTNAPADEYKINCRGIKPNWNMVIPISAMEKNAALINNPDPTNTVDFPSPVGEYSRGEYAE